MRCDRCVRCAAGVAVALLMPCGGAAAAETTLDALLRTLRDNGTLTDSQYRDLADGPDGAVRAKGTGAVRLGGRVMVDVAFYDEDMAALGAGTELRRARAPSGLSTGL